MFLVMVVLNLLEEKDLMKQVNAALVIIPLLLRIINDKIRGKENERK